MEVTYKLKSHKWQSLAVQPLVYFPLHPTTLKCEHRDKGESIMKLQHI